MFGACCQSIGEFHKNHPSGFELVLLTPVLIFYSYFADIVCLDIKYFILICLFSSFYPFIDYLLIINRFNYNVKFVVICSLVTAVLSELLSICFVLTFDDKALYAAIKIATLHFAQARSSLFKSLFIFISFLRSFIKCFSLFLQRIYVVFF